MSWVPIIGIIASLIGVGLLAITSLIGAGLSFYFYWKSRTSSYREILYSNQLEGYRELAEVMEKIIFLVFTVKGKKELGEYLIGRQSDFRSKIIKWLNILPQVVNEEFAKFYILVLDESKKLEEGNFPDENALMDASQKVYDIAQKYFGIEPLSQETRDLIMRSDSRTS